ncbi:hypothetical protein X781_19950 [Mannheimia sp. USDA-ARS-USMARC-1261]|uniref:hypothetical protein n=1 Tax=Mannheimia sp. USDA-ARS-USMARC-1261 TaxID=1432056 RepID=UPI0003E3EEAA|nr:hypothetical protein [Mannheimia sp. USDA-ARS-USMARC-1261]AHG74140.1 hypothetical protein X781_19950 [Mannheimia sp. USDA-ARS-USMARC-1261]
MFFYIPFYYLFRTRLVGKSAKFAWIFTYIIPTYVVYFYMMNAGFMLYFLLLLATFSAYELGYIYNDAELVKKENNPTLRLSQQEHVFYEKNKKFIYSIRLLWVVISNVMVFCLYKEYFIFILLNSLSILLVYVVYNSIRNEFNIILYSLLLILKYFGVYVFMLGDLGFLFVSWLLYPLCNTLDFATKARFFTSHYLKIDNFDKFRVQYYIFLVMLIYILGYFDSLPYSEFFNVLALYFLVYRTLLYLFVVKKFR